jgi:acetamidase/formamidase
MEHQIDAKRIHHGWDNRLEPTLRVASGDVVHYDILMAGHGQVHEGDGFEQTNFDFDTLYNLPGPLYVEGARPGDTLKIEILDLKPGEWGWCVILPELGTVPDHFPDPYLRTFDLRGGTHVDFAPGEGALFSCGDPHAMQGDGEVCVAAMECDMHASLRFSVEERTIPAPHFRTAGALTSKVDARGHHGAMGIAPDLMDGTRKSVLAMVEWIVAEHGLSREDAYMLCSLAGDLKILEVVDAGMWNVGFTLPLSIFVEQGAAS